MDEKIQQAAEQAVTKTHQDFSDSIERMLTEKLKSFEDNLEMAQRSFGQAQLRKIQSWLCVLDNTKTQCL